MCGRFTQRLDAEEIREMYGVADRDGAPALKPRYNGAPTQDLAACRTEGRGGGRRIVLLRWGLVPPGAPDLRVGARLINARAESVGSRAAFADAFRARRCLVPADGWFEWVRRGRQRHPYFLTLESGAPVSFAGLWERWEGRETPVETFTVITTAAAPGIRAVHDRQPAIIAPDRFTEWLDPATPEDRLLALAREAPAGPYSVRPVSLRVNRVANDDPGILTPIPELFSLGSR